MTMKIRIIIEADLTGRCDKDRVSAMVAAAAVQIEEPEDPMIVTHNVRAWWTNVDPPGESFGHEVRP